MTGKRGLGSSILIWFLAIMPFFLMGCTHTQPKEVIYQTTNVFKNVPAELLKPIEITAPPSVPFYTKSNAQERENILTNYSIQLIKDLDVCNGRIKNISIWDSQQNNLFNNKEE